MFSYEEDKITDLWFCLGYIFEFYFASEKVYHHK